MPLVERAATADYRARMRAMELLSLAGSGAGIVLNNASNYSAMELQGIAAQMKAPACLVLKNSRHSGMELMGIARAGRGLVVIEVGEEPARR